MARKPKWLGKTFVSKEGQKYEIIDEYPELRQYYVRGRDGEFYIPISTFRKKMKMVS